jgi:nitrite reductase/ring-hydroxylating ferredoxin subunit/uncharacterized membrane protein
MAMSLSRRADAAIRQLQRVEWLDSLGRALAVAVSNVVRPGVFKDLLSGTWLGHPAHPMLTDLPIGAWTSAFVLDALGGESAADASATLTGMGVLTALPTALTGLSDLSDIGEKEDRSLGVAHALGNVTALTLYALSYVQRRRGRRGSGVALSLAGGAVVTGSAYLGGHLVYRRAIGPSQNALEPVMADWTPALDDTDLHEGEPKRVNVQGTNILLFRDGERILALANRCGHRGGPLHKGEIGGGRVTCPWHLSTFSLEDGSVIRGPATAPQPAYDARVRQGKIEIRSKP